MAAIQPAFDIRCLGTIKNVNTTPPSVVIVPALGGPLVTATGFTPTQLSTMLMCLSIDMRQVTYVMKPDPDGYRAHEVFCVGEVPSVVKEEEKDTFFHSEGADRQKAKSGRRKENSDNGRIVAPPSPTFGPIEEKWSRDGKSHKVLCSKEDAIMGYVLRQTISRSQETSKAATPHHT